MLPRSIRETALAIIVALAGVSTASAFTATGVGVGASAGTGGIGGVSVGAGKMSAITGPSGSVVNGLGPVFAMPQRWRDLNVTGQVGVKQANLPQGATVVRLSLNGQEIPMRLDTELQTAELQFDPNNGYARDLYRSILTKRVEVVGEQELRDQLAQAAQQSKPLQIEGYVFDRTSPYFVIKSVKPE